MTSPARRSRQPSHPEMTVLGLDVGGTKLAAGVVTGDGRVLSRAVVPSDAAGGPTSMIERLIELGHAVVGESGVAWASIDGIGIACGGPLDPRAGVILSPPNLPGWDDIPLANLVSTAMRRPAVVENDATAGALAEWWFGAGSSRAIDDLVYLTISTGIGGGLVIDGEIYRGATGNAGELGHLTVDRHGRMCNCGRRGCLEAYASGTNIAARAREALATGERSSLENLPAITANDVATHAAEGDDMASRIWNESMEILGSAVANIIDVFDPDLVVLGGGVTRAGDRLLLPVREIGLRLAYGPAAGNAEIVLAGLGDRHDVVSAAVVALDRLSPVAPRQQVSA